MVMVETKGFEPLTPGRRFDGPFPALCCPVPSSAVLSGSQPWALSSLPSCPAPFPAVR